MFKITNYMIEKINESDNELLACKLYNNGNMITGYDILELCIETIKSFNGKYCYYMDALNDNLELWDYEPHKKDRFSCVNGGYHLVMRLFNAMCYLDLLSHRYNRVRWTKQKTYSLVFSNNILNESEEEKRTSPKYTKKEASENDPIAFVRMLYKLPSDARDFAIEEYATRLSKGNNSVNSITLYNTKFGKENGVDIEFADDVRVSDHWGSRFGVPTVGSITIDGTWAWGRITKKHGRFLWDIKISEKPVPTNITIANKGLILDKVVNEIYNVAPKQVKIIENYRAKLNKGLTK